tara:strand:+ start:2718 stop:3545 length:828 start_codon:yes stop_codon:yes gene_type:complete
MKPYLTTKDHAVSGEKFELLYDEDLDMLLTRPQPEDLARYYQSDAYISHTDANRSLVDKGYQAVKRFSLGNKLGLVAKHAKGDKTLLDFGAGTGDFLIEARQRGWEIFGVEPNLGARQKALEKGVELLSEIPKGGPETYDVITLWHVLEHLPDLENQINRLVTKLSQQGTMFVAVPNFKSFDAKHYGAYWAAFDVPRHLWHFSKNAIEILFERQGLKVVAIKPMVFDSFYVSMLSEQYKHGKTKYGKAFFIGLLSNIKAWRSKEYSSHIFILQHK